MDPNPPQETAKNNAIRPEACYQPGQPVSVVLICRDKVANLEFILDALRNNTRRPDFVVLSDDASTDDSCRVFTELCACFRLAGQVIPHPALGPAPAFRINTLRNDGINACPEGLVIVLDADLVPARTLIETHIALHLKHAPRLTVSTGPRLEYACSDRSGPINFMWGHEPVAMLQASETTPVSSWSAIPGSLMAITKQAADEIGHFDPAYDGHYGCDDVDFMYRAWRHGVFFAASFEAYAIHIPHPPVFGRRNSDTNRARFKRKHGFDVYRASPGIHHLMGQDAWNERYQKLLRAEALLQGSPVTWRDFSDDIFGHLSVACIGKIVVRQIQHRLRNWTAGLLSWRS